MTSSKKLERAVVVVDELRVELHAERDVLFQHESKLLVYRAAAARYAGQRRSYAVLATLGVLLLGTADGLSMADGAVVPLDTFTVTSGFLTVFGLVMTIVGFVYRFAVRADAANYGKIADVKATREDFVRLYERKMASCESRIAELMIQLSDAEQDLRVLRRDQDRFEEASRGDDP
jgi:hypothetical protein